MFLLQRKEKRYYPTRLAINLASGLSSLATDAHRQGYIVVETNYRVYAYTGKIVMKELSILTDFITVDLFVGKFKLKEVHVLWNAVY